MNLDAKFLFKKIIELYPFDYETLSCGLKKSWIHDYLANKQGYHNVI